MKVILEKGPKLIIRLDSGEEVIELMRMFCLERNLDAGFFFALGSASECVLSSYDLGKKQYRDTTITDELEIAGLFGNVTKKDDDVVIHAHGNFSNKEPKTFAGHVKRVVVSATCEVVLETLGVPIQRKFDEKTGLNILQ